MCGLQLATKNVIRMQYPTFSKNDATNAPKQNDNAKSDFLVVVNCDTKYQNFAMINKALNNHFSTKPEIFNISNTGSFKDPNCQNRSILSNYEGKTIIFFGNPTYLSSQPSTYEIWDLLDPWEVTRLAKLHTNFLFLDTLVDSPSFNDWRFYLKLPVARNAVMSSIDAANLPGLITELEPWRRDAIGPERRHMYHQYTSHVKLISAKEDLVSDLLVNSRRDAKQLKEVYPLRRFLLSPHLGLGSGRRKGTVTVFEGLPLDANIRMTELKPDHSNQKVLLYLLVNSIPFEKRVHLFWQSLQDEQQPGTEKADFTTALTISLKNTLFYSLFYFCTAATNRIPMNQLVSHYRHLQTFFTYRPPKLHHIGHLLNLLVPLLAFLTPRTCGEHLTAMFFPSLSPKRYLTKLCAPELSRILTDIYGEKDGPVVLAEVRKQASGLADWLRKEKCPLKAMEKHTSEDMMDFMDADHDELGMDIARGGAFENVACSGNKLECYRRSHDRFMRKVRRLEDLAKVFFGVSYVPGRN